MSFPRSLSPRRRGVGIHDLRREIGFQIKPALSKAEWVWNDKSRRIEILRPAYPDAKMHRDMRRNSE